MTRFATAAAQFPDYDVTTIPADLPEDFTDQSWGNDTCPSFFSVQRQMTLYIDYPDAAQREIPETPRYGLHRADDTGANVSLIIASDDWVEILAALESTPPRLAIPALPEDGDRNETDREGFEEFASGKSLYSLNPVHRDGWWLAYARCYGQGVKAAMTPGDTDSPYPQFSTAWEAWADGHDAAGSL